MNMMKYNQYSRSVTIFHAFPSLEEGSTLAGYAALIEGHIFTPQHKPDDTLRGQLTFALKHEGVDLASLLAGLIAACQMLAESDYDAVLMAAIIAFAFYSFIHLKTVTVVFIAIFFIMSWQKKGLCLKV